MWLWRAAAVTVVIGLGAASTAYADRTFAPRYAATDRGSIALAGNTVLTCSGSSSACRNARDGVAGASGNDDLSMAYVDVDGSSATFDSSRATLTLPPGATVLFAGLYWGGDTSAGASGAAAPNAAQRNIVRLTTPAAGAQTITAATVDTDAAAATRYQGFANVTPQVAVGGSGTYTVANVQTGTGINRYGGWGLVVAYRLGSEPVRRLLVNDGFLALGAMTRPVVDVPFSGFLTPASGTVRARLGAIAYEGDRSIATDALAIGDRAVVDAANPTWNFFNGTRSRDGAALTTGSPAYANTLGIDVDDALVDGYLGNGATSTTVRTGTWQDEYLLGAVALAVDESPPVNTTPPAISGTTTEGATLSADPGAWSATPPVAYDYRWQRCNASGASCANIAGATSPTLALTAADVGSTIRVVVTATNAAGATSATSAATAVVAADPPETTVTSGPSGITNDATPTFAFSSDEPGGSFQCRVDGAAFAACGSPHTTAPLADGPHTFEVRAVDPAGASDPTPASRTFTVDATAPDTTVTAGPSGPTGAATPAFSFTASEPDATFECRTDGGDFEPCTSPRAVGPLADGQHTFEVRAVDPAGNRDPTPAARTFTVDTDPAETTITEGASGPGSDPTPTFAFAADEAGATFQCRVDDAAFSPCTSPLTTSSLADGAHTFEVRAVDAADNTDPTPATRAFTVDAAAPDSVIDTGPAGATSDATPTFTLTSSEPGAAFECRVDDAAFAPCESPHTTAPLADGEHTFEVRAIDPAGNADPTPASRAFTVDTVPPETTITGGPSGTTEDPTPTFEFTAAAGATFECRVDGGAFTACESPFTTAELADGAHTFEVRASDAAGNVDPTPAVRAFTVQVVPPDPNAPETTIDSGPQGATSDTTPAFAFSADEPATFECRIDDVAFAPCSSPYSTAPLGDGQHVFEVRATDLAGNTDATPASRTFIVDTAAPETVLTAAPPAATDDPTPTFAFEADEHGARFECSVDGGAFAPCASPLTLPALPDGDHTLEIRAVDQAGNADPSPASSAFTIDTGAPQTTIESGPSGVIADATPAFTFSADEPATFACRIDGGAYAPCTSPLTLSSLSDGDHVLEVRATDAAGNPDPSPAARVFTVDTDPPETTIAEGPAGPTGDATPSFAFESDEPGLSFECRVDDAPFAACDSPHTTARLTDGAHTFEVRAIDPAGSADPSPATRSFTVDTSGPDTTIDSGPSGPTSNATPVFSFSSGEPDTSFECRIDGGAFAACASPHATEPLGDGEHTFEVRAVDATGNVDATPAARTISVDTTAPSTTITDGPESPTGDATTTFEFTADEPGATFECRVDDGAFAPCGSPFTSPALADGPHRFEVRAVDPAGNADPIPASRSFVVDTDVPDTTVTAGPTGPTADPTPTFEFQSDEPGARFECRLDGAAFADCASPLTTGTLADGPHTLEIRAVDLAGNADPEPAVREFTVERRPPETVIGGGPTGVTDDPTPTFTFTADEPGTRFECRIDAGPYDPCTSPYTVPELPDGAHVLEVRSIDPAGNVDPTAARWAFTVQRRASPPSPGVPTAPACADGADNDSDGAVDALDPGCLSRAGYVATDPSEVDDPAELPASQLVLRCDRAELKLIDVRLAGRRVRITGAARPAYVGRRVAIHLLPGGRRVATARVARDGSFRAAVRSLRSAVRASSRTRFEARAGRARSLALKLNRRTMITSARVRGGRLAIAGRIVPPLARPPAPVVIRRQVSCRRSVVAGRVRPRANGTFRASLPLPRGRAAIYTTSSRVRGSARTFSLPTPVTLR
jgi:hypothetical protein